MTDEPVMQTSTSAFLVPADRNEPWREHLRDEEGNKDKK
jgi:hypothetical protein